MLWFAIAVAVALRLLGWFVWVASPLPECSTTDLHLEGRISDLRAAPERQRFVLVVDKSPCAELAGERIRLTWYRPSQSLVDGETISVIARIKPGRGSLNPGAFNYQHWLFSQNVRATGYVRSVQMLASRPAAQSGTLLHLGLLRALARGDRTGVTAQEWELLRRTGTIHLLVVSGLHVGIVAGIAFGLAFVILRLVPGPFRFVSRRSVALLASAAAVLWFADLGEWQAPLMRAASTLCCALACLLWRRQPGRIRLLALVMAVSLLLVPGHMLQQGFWLSHLGVLGLVAYFAPRQRLSGAVTALCVCQGVMLLTLTPWLGLLAGEVPLITLPVNMVAVPFVSLICAPLAMAGVALASTGLEGLAAQVLLCADFAMHVLLELLAHAAQSTWSIGFWGLAGALWGAGAVACMQVRQGWRALLAAALLWSSLLLAPRHGITPGTFRVQILDVGQGSAAIVDTAHHRLVVDTGPAFDGGFDAGAAIVLPVLRRTGNNQLHRILISHFDNDHAGGLSALQDRFPSADLLTPDDCLRRGPWAWDGVRFSLLQARGLRSKNDRSCTLLVSTPGHSLYFSGDIGTRAELQLLSDLPRGVDTLIAPHHGSASSSHPAFVHHLRPTRVVFSAGYANRYGHPRPDVVRRYQRYAVEILNTADTGAITITSEQADAEVMRMGQ